MCYADICFYLKRPKRQYQESYFTNQDTLESLKKIQ